MNRDGFQITPVLIDDNTCTVSAATQSRNINLREKLPEYIRSNVGHVCGLMIEQDADMTYTTAPTQVGVANAIQRLTLRGEGGRIHLDASGPDVRAFEYYENGGPVVSPDPDLNGGSTNNLYSRRFINFAPGGFRMTDFAVCNKLLDAGVLELVYNVLTGYSADTTAGTVRTLIYALCAGLPEVRVAPKVERKFWAGSGNQLELGERGLLTHMMMLNSSDHDAITAADFGAISLDDRHGPVLTGIDAEVLSALYAAQQRSGQFSLVYGEPRAATDDNFKVVNGASPTAVANPIAGSQAVVWSPRDGARITKVEVEGPLKLRWNGSQATSHVLTTRILPRAEDEARDMAVRVFRSMKLPFKGGKIKTESKAGYAGPRAEYMPWSFKFR